LEASGAPDRARDVSCARDDHEIDTSIAISSVARD
jgi:hypothetical protein